MAKFGKPKPIWITEMCLNTHIHPYGVSELRSADLLVRFHVLALASRQDREGVLVDAQGRRRRSSSTPPKWWGWCGPTHRPSTPTTPTR